MNNILVINTGSSSIKYQLFEMDTKKVLASGLMERIGEKTAKHTYKSVRSETGISEEKNIPDHWTGISEMDRLLTDSKNGVIQNTSEISGIGHRVVHGGETFTKPTRIDGTVIRAIEENIPLAPLHNPANLSGIYAAEKFFKGVPNIAVFDTSFHQSIPEFAFRYALPTEYYSRHRIRRYGFHGTSHQYITKKTAEYLERDINSLNIISLHLGNGASVCAVRNGKSFDTSMGMTPLEGLIMGTRTGDIDPAVHFYLADHTGLSFKEIDNVFNKQSGLKGICGSNDMRDILQKMHDGDRNAKLAFEMYCYRIRKYIGSYIFALEGKTDAVVFTAGVGENSPDVRKKVLEGLQTFGLGIDIEKNSKREPGIRDLSTVQNTVRVLVVPTNEELEIAEQSLAVLTE